MIILAGSRESSQASLKAFKHAVNPRIDYMVMVSYPLGNDNLWRHGFIVIQDMGQTVTVVEDSFTSGNFEAGSWALIDALRMAPDFSLMLNLVLKQEQAEKLFGGELGRVQTLDLIRRPKVLKITWEAQGLSAPTSFEPHDSTMCVVSTRQPYDASMAAVAR